MSPVDMSPPVEPSMLDAIAAFDSVMTGMKEPCLLVATDDSIVVANAVARAEFGVDPQDETEFVTDLLSGAYDAQTSDLPSTSTMPGSVDSVRRLLDNAWRSGQAIPATVVVGRPLRRWRCEAWRLRVGPGGAAPFLVMRFRSHERSIERFAVLESQLQSLNTEVLRHRRTEGRLRAATERLQTVFGSAPIGMAVAEVGVDGVVVLSKTNPALCRLAGRSAPEIDGLALSTLIGDEVFDDVAPMIERLAGEAAALSFDVSLNRPDGAATPVTVSVSRLLEDDVVDDDASRAASATIVLQFVDLTERHRYEEQLRQLADYDALTGLVNRRFFDEELERTVARVRLESTTASIMLIDLDHFKGTNDSHGHATGDRLLQQVAHTLTSRLRDTDVVGRHGGDEFAVLLFDTDVETAWIVAESLLADILDASVFEPGGQAVRTTATIGIAPITGDLAADQVMVEADLAMYEAKRAGRDRIWVADPTGDQRERARAGHSWLQRIRDALSCDLFVLYAQPLLDLRSGAVTRHEILLRLDDGDGTPIPPAEFLYVAERHGLIQAIDKWVVDHSVAVLQEWQRDPNGVRSTDVLEVNLSGVTITDQPTIDFIEQRISESGIDATRLIFEITETAAIVNIERAQQFARRLAALGCGFALDDVGSGFGSFYYLKHLPSDVIKIDGDYIKDLPSSSIDQLIVRAIVDIAHGLGKEVVAEWVESQETLDLLTDYGIAYAQGFHVGRPQPATELTV